MTILSKTRLWCQESPNNPISTKLRRHTTPIIVLFTATILAVSLFLFYMPHMVAPPVTQTGPEPVIPTQPGPNTSPTAENNTGQKQTVTPTYTQPPPDYPTVTPSETHLKVLDTKLVFNEQGQPVLQVIQEGQVIAEYTNVTLFVGGSTIDSAHYFVRLANGTIINVTSNWP